MKTQEQYSILAAQAEAFTEVVEAVKKLFKTKYDLEGAIAWETFINCEIRFVAYCEEKPWELVKVEVYQARVLDESLYYISTGFRGKYCSFSRITNNSGEDSLEIGSSHDLAVDKNVNNFESKNLDAHIVNLLNDMCLD